MSELLNKHSMGDAPVWDFTDSSDDVLTAYLELALKIYLRIKNEGKSIHTCGFDDDEASCVPSSRQRSFSSTNSDSNS